MDGRHTCEGLMASNRGRIVVQAGSNSTQMPLLLHLLLLQLHSPPTLQLLCIHITYIRPLCHKNTSSLYALYANITVHAVRLLLQPFRLYQRAGLNRYFKTKFRSQVIVGYIVHQIPLIADRCDALTSISDRAHLLLHIGLVDQPLLEKDKQGGLAGFPHLVVRVSEELDDEGEEVGGDDLVHRVGQLLAVHRDVGHLLHQLCSNARF